MARIALFNRETGIAVYFTLRLGAREGNDTTVGGKQLALGKSLFPQRPAEVGAQRNLHVRVTYSAHVVAIGIDLRNLYRVYLSRHCFGREDTHDSTIEVGAVVPIWEPARRRGKIDIRDFWETLQRLFGRH